MITLVKTEKAKDKEFSRRFPRRQYTNTLGVLHRGFYRVEMGVEIGEGGLLFQTERELEIGTCLILNFYIPKGGFVSVKAQILYASPTKTKKQRAYGVKFDNLAFECRRMIRDYIAEKTYNEAAVF